MRHGGKILIDQLEAQGATTAFTVPGESFLAALDGLHDSNRIKTIICRQEGGASMMAEAWGKITGEPGICFVTRGPGAANAMSGLHVAQQDSTPMVAFVGMPAARPRGPRGVPGDRDQAAVLLVREVGGRDPPDRAHPRVREPRLPRRPLRPARPRRARPARGHAGGRLRDRRRQARPHRRGRSPAPPTSAPLQEKLAKAAAPADDHRRPRLERRRPEGDRGLRRPLRPARRAGLPLPGLLRQPPSLLRRLRRHRHRRQARRRHQGGRPADRGRRAPRRDDDQPATR